MNIIELTDIGKSYIIGKTRVNALSKINVEIKKGEFTAIAGPSGSGKTSLLNIIGLIDKPDTGSFLLNGEDTTHMPLNNLADLRRKTIGFVFQTFNLIPVFNAFENVEYPLIFTDISKKEKKIGLTISCGLSAFQNWHDTGLSKCRAVRGRGSPLHGHS